jgi:hypothetical protein
MLKDILRAVVMLSLLLLALFAFVAFVAFIFRLLEILPQYIGGFMTFWVIIAIMVLFFTICYYIVKRNE